MTKKKLYLTTKENYNTWNYVGDPLNPHTTLDVGTVVVDDKREIEVDDFGAYVIRYLKN